MGIELERLRGVLKKKIQELIESDRMDDASCFLSYLQQLDGLGPVPDCSSESASSLKIDFSTVGLKKDQGPLNEVHWGAFQGEPCHSELARSAIEIGQAVNQGLSDSDPVFDRQNVGGHLPGTKQTSQKRRAQDYPLYRRGDSKSLEIISWSKKRKIETVRKIPKEEILTVASIIQSVAGPHGYRIKVNEVAERDGAFLKSRLYPIFAFLVQIEFVDRFGKAGYRIKKTTGNLDYVREKIEALEDWSEEVGR